MVAFLFLVECSNTCILSVILKSEKLRKQSILFRSLQTEPDLSLYFTVKTDVSLQKHFSKRVRNGYIIYVICDYFSFLNSKTLKIMKLN